MKKINKYFLTITALIASFSMLVSCDNDFENPNSTTSKTILTTRDGLFALSIGVRQLYSTTTLPLSLHLKHPLLLQEKWQIPLLF
jgi:hypothetical protein